MGSLSRMKFLSASLKWVYVSFLRPAENLKKYWSWALVTGSTDGIGKGFAYQLAWKGLNLLLGFTWFELSCMDTLLRCVAVSGWLVRENRRGAVEWNNGGWKDVLQWFGCCFGGGWGWVINEEGEDCMGKRWVSGGALICHCRDLRWRCLGDTAFSS